MGYFLSSYGANLSSDLYVVDVEPAKILVDGGPLLFERSDPSDLPFPLNALNELFVSSYFAPLPAPAPPKVDVELELPPPMKLLNMLPPLLAPPVDAPVLADAALFAAGSLASDDWD